MVDRPRNPIDLPTTYEQWLAAEQIPVTHGFHVPDLNAVEVAPWPRKGALGARIALDGTAQTNDAYVCEIPPRGEVTPQRHLFEELIYVLRGRGATTVWNDGPKQSFEWHEGSLFSVPLNIWHQHFNLQGDEPVRYIAVTNAPFVMNLFHDLDFVFNNGYVFQSRFRGEEDYFSGKANFYPDRVLETNFVADVPSFPLMDWQARGAGGKNVKFELANNTMAAHVSEFPVGTYKKAHRHGPGAHVIIIGGKGYSLLWPEGQQRRRVDWQVGSMFVPPERWFHQHFNSGATPARYLALRWGSRKFKLPSMWDEDKLEIDMRAGGDQIEYEDEDPQIRRLFEEECRRSGAELRMPPVARRARA
ncbi:MAG: cupin domain-containing protein [Acidobacteria bacterium]|nr:cupin domain-containing protein [Acidobacteriota bacterium]